MQDIASRRAAALKNSGVPLVIKSSTAHTSNGFPECFPPYRSTVLQSIKEFLALSSNHLPPLAATGRSKRSIGTPRVTWRLQTQDVEHICARVPLVGCLPLGSPGGRRILHRMLPQSCGQVDARYRAITTSTSIAVMIIRISSIVTRASVCWSFTPYYLTT